MTENLNASPAVQVSSLAPEPNPRSRILIDPMMDGAQYEYAPDDLGIDGGEALTAERVIAELKEFGTKYETARDLCLLDEKDWKLYVQVQASDGTWTRAEW